MYDCGVSYPIGMKLCQPSRRLNFTKAHHFTKSRSTLITILLEYALAWELNPHTAGWREPCFLCVQVPSLPSSPRARSEVLESGAAIRLAHIFRSSAGGRH